MSVATLEELEAVPIGQSVSINVSDRTGRQTWMRTERGLQLNGNDVPLGTFVGAIADGRVEADAVLAANNGRVAAVDHGFTLGQRVGTDAFLTLPVGTKVQGSGDSRYRTIRGEGNYTFDDEQAQAEHPYLHDGGTFTITELPEVTTLAADSSAAVAGAVEQWLTDHDGYYLGTAEQDSLRDLLRGFGIEAQQAEREVTVEIYIEGWTEVGGDQGVDATAVVPGVQVESVDDVATIRWSHTINHTVTSRNPDPCQDHTLISTAWVTERLNEAGIRFTGFSIEERGCDAD